MRNILFSIFFLFSFIIFGQNSNIDTVRLKKHIKFLTSDSCEGRNMGARGNIIAAKYIKSEFEKIGLRPYKNGIEQFTLKSNRSIDSSSYFIVGNKKYVLGQDFNPSFLSSIGRTKANAVFVKDITKLDVKMVENKWLIFSADSTDVKNPLKLNQEKIFIAKDAKAAGVLIVVNNNSPELNKKQSNISIDYNLPIVFISKDFESILFEMANIKMNNYYTDTTVTVVDFPLEIEANCSINYESLVGENVVFELPAKNSGKYLIVGAHYDHLGFGGTNSGSRTPEYNQIHYGADDNASGVAGMIETARILSESAVKLERNIIFIAFDGEEKGLLGSKYFVDNLSFSKDSIIAMINFDMIGRMKENNTFGIAGTGTASELEDILKTYLDTNKVKITFQADGYGGSDQTSFYTSKIPVMFFTTGGHPDYHTPLDTENKINYRGMSLLLNYSFEVISDLTSNERLLHFKETRTKNNDSPSKMKATLGIMPDVTSSENNGLRVDGVNPDGAAKKAGIIKGDIIISINDKKISNIYEYMHSMSKYNKGQEIDVEVLRESKSIKLKVIL